MGKRFVSTDVTARLNLLIVFCSLLLVNYTGLQRNRPSNNNIMDMKPLCAESTSVSHFFYHA